MTSFNEKNEFRILIKNILNVITDHFTTSGQIFFNWAFICIPIDFSEGIFYGLKFHSLCKWSDVHSTPKIIAGKIIK